MEAFEIGSCFKSYNELMQKLNEYCEGTCTKFTTKDSRLITGEFAAAKESFVYSELKLICVYGRTNKFKEQNRKRKMRTIKIPKTECPAYFRIKLINSGVALQIVAMNKNHNHPLEKIEEESEVPKVKKKKGGIKKEVKSEDDASSDDMQPPEYIELYIDPDDPQDSKVKFKFGGLCVPVFNIFREDLSLKTGSVGKYAQYLWDNGVRGVVVNHGAGEGMSITVAERKLVAEEWVTAAKNLKMHIMIQVGACPLPDAIELAKHAENLEADSILSIPELYFKPSTNEDLVDYLKIISEAAPKTPLIYNHNPDVTGVELDMVEFIKNYASEIPTFCGLEYISHDIDKGESILDVNNGRYTIFFGVDSLVTSAFSLGFESAILPSANIYPKQVISMMKATKDSKTEARKLQKQLNTNCNIITNFGFWISSMKTAMNLISTVKVGICRPPLKNVSDEDMNAMKTKLELED